MFLSMGVMVEIELNGSPFLEMLLVKKAHRNDLPLIALELSTPEGKALLEERLKEEA